MQSGSWFFPRIIVVATLSVTLAVVAIGCGGDDDKQVESTPARPTASPIPPQTPTPEVVPATADAKRDPTPLPSPIQALTATVTPQAPTAASPGAATARTPPTQGPRQQVAARVTPIATPTHTPTAAPTARPVPTPSRTPTSTLSPTPQPTAVVTPSEAAIATPTAVTTPATIPTPTVTKATASPSPRATPKPESTPTPTSASPTPASPAEAVPTSPTPSTGKAQPTATAATPPAEPQPTATATTQPAEPQPTATATTQPAEPQPTATATTQPAEPQPTATATTQPAESQPTATATIAPSQPTATPVPAPTPSPSPTVAAPATPTAPAAIDFDPTVHVQVSSGGVFITWISTQEEDGYVDWALSAEDLANRSGSFSTTGDQRGALAGRANKRTHRVVVANLVGVPAIHYQIVTGGEADPNGPYEVSIPTGALITLPNAITGRVLYEDGSPGVECLVHVRVTQRHDIEGNVFLENSLWVNEMTSTSPPENPALGGAYVTDITNVRQDPQNQLNNDYNRALPYNTDAKDATLTVGARCGRGLQGSISVTTADAEKSGFGYINMDVVVSGVASAP